MAFMQYHPKPTFKHRLMNKSILDLLMNKSRHCLPTLLSPTRAFKWKAARTILIVSNSGSTFDRLNRTTLSLSFAGFNLLSVSFVFNIRELFAKLSKNSLVFAKAKRFGERPSLLAIDICISKITLPLIRAMWTIDLLIALYINHLLRKAKSNHVLKTLFSPRLATVFKSLVNPRVHVRPRLK